MVHSQALQLGLEQEAYTRRRRIALIMVIAAYAGASWYAEQALFKQPYHTSILSGQMWVREIIGGNPQHIEDQLGVAKHVFRQLIWQISLWTSATHTCHVGLDGYFPVHHGDKPVQQESCRVFSKEWLHYPQVCDAPISLGHFITIYHA